MKRLFDPSKVEVGKEKRTLLIASSFLAFWTFVAFADVLDGVIKVRGSSTPITFADEPFWFAFYFVLILSVEGLALLSVGFIAIVLLRRRKS